MAFFRTMKGYGIDVVAAFSTEIAHVDPSSDAGMAQRYWDSTPVLLNTPAVQTNFSANSLSFWQGVYSSMAGLQASAGLTPYLQSGEVQWWYSPKPAVANAILRRIHKTTILLVERRRIDGADY